MIFQTDKQTLEDLNIFGGPLSESVFGLFDHTHTHGGAELLMQMFSSPLDGPDEINRRSGTIQFFGTLKMNFPFGTGHLDAAEIYLKMADRRIMLPDNENLVGRLTQLVAGDGDYKAIIDGVVSIAEMARILETFIKTNEISAINSAYRDDLLEIATLLGSQPFKDLLQESPGVKLPRARLAELDKLLRFDYRLRVRALLRHIYRMDVFLTVASVATKNNYVLAHATQKVDHTIRLKGCYHPLLKNAKANDVVMNAESNIFFLTGANMAGKSTLMKSIAIAIYLAHIGFPVAAVSMDFSVRDGIYTTINLPDDFSSGSSHFYAEVMRIKNIAKEIAAGNSLFVVFDELFRGTNVKDAYQGTVALTEAFSGKTNCMFVISTHITEAGEALKNRCGRINFVYLPTRIEDNQMVYTYKLLPGISADRHGMIIIDNEHILDIIRSRKNKTAPI